MTRWQPIVGLVMMTQMVPWPIGGLDGASALSLLVGLVGLWSLWRVRRLLQIVPQLEKRLGTLTNSVALLTDTTESCFRAVSMQMQLMQSPPAKAAVRRASQAPELPVEPAGPRKARQRRVVSAARRGEAPAAIAAREGLAESEIALRLHVAGKSVPADKKSHGSMFS